VQALPASAPAAAASQDLIKLQLSADPPYAEIVLDGAKLEGNPFSERLAKDNVLHRLEVRAPGRRTEARMVHLDQDLTLHITLVLAAAPASASSTPAAAPPGGKPAAKTGTGSDDFVHKQRDTKAARPIDNSDPYGP
jgi:hypothetical protein